MATNFILDSNPFNLAGPPAWWLAKLHEFDPSLVVVPSRQQFVYRLAQRRPLTLKDKFTQDQMWEHSDMRMLARYGLIPVTSIIATCNWSNPLMFEELRNRAPWRQFRTTDDAVNAVEAQDQKGELDIASKNDQLLSYVSKDAWGLYQKKIGLRSQMWSPKTTPTRLPAARSAAVRIVSPSEAPNTSRFSL